MDTFYTFWDNVTHYKTESRHFWGLTNSATKFRSLTPESEKPKPPAPVPSGPDHGDPKPSPGTLHEHCRVHIYLEWCFGVHSSGMSLYRATVE